jgi:adenylate cyclase
MSKSRPERKLAAILAADVAGYSRLMGADEAGTLDEFKSCLTDAVVPLITSFGGRIFKTMGDGLLAEFSSAVDAVECAVKMQSRLAERNRDRAPEKRIEFRVAINLGDVIDDGGDMFGDGVNVAARLQPLAEPGEICVSQAVYQQVVGKLDIAFTDMGTRILKNIATPARVFRIDMEHKSGAGTQSTLTLHDSRPSIAVLPFDILSDDKKLELLADGLVEDVTALLARVPGFFVIARSSSFAYRGQSPDVREVGHELGVRYVVQGSVRASGQRVRVTAQLVDAETGRQLWNHRFEVDRNETFDLQDQIARAIMIELEPELIRAELKLIQRQRPDNLDTWSMFRKALGAISVKGWNEDSAAEAIGELRRTIAVDPNFALAHALLALLTAFGANMALINDNSEVRTEAKAAAERAIALDPESSEVLGFAGCAIADLGEDARGIEYLRHAVAIDPSNAQALMALGAAQTRLGQFDEGIANMRLAMQRSPRDSRIAFWAMLLADALRKAGRVQEALAEATGASRRDGRLYLSRVVAALALVKLGRMEEARAALAEGRRIRPVMTQSEVGKFFGQSAVADLKPLWQESNSL